MGGAVLVTLVTFALVLRRRAPVLAPSFDLPTQTRIDRPLVVGAVVFGLGWGLSGVCPGPALVSIATLSPASLVFAAGMLLGTVAFRAPEWIRRRAARPSADAESSPAE
jgi:uncharacterized membrane protein YedE/YeeE